MFILVVFLNILSMPRVWTKPTVAHSELASATEDDATRFKRQAKFVELLHQIIDKYANSPDEQLAPLKALVDYKPYQTPVRAANPNENIPNLMCKNINLCSIQNPPIPKAPGYNTYMPPILRKPLDTNAFTTKQNRPSFPSNTNYYLKIPNQGSFHNRFINLLTKLKPDYTYYRLGNNSYFPLKQDTVNRFLVGQPYTKQAINFGIKNNSGPQMMLGSALENIAKIEENVEPILGENIKNCSYSKVTIPGSQNIQCQEHPEKTETASDENLDILYPQLDNDDKEDLDEILEIFSAPRLEVEMTEQRSDDFTITEDGSTIFPTLTTIQEPSLVGAKVPKKLNPKVYAVVYDLSEDQENENSNVTRNHNNSQDFKPIHSNNRDVQSSANKYPVNSTIEPAKSYTTMNQDALEPSNKTFNKPLRYRSNILSTDLNLNRNKSQERTDNKMKTLLAAIPNKSNPENSKQNYTKDDTKPILNENNKTPNTSKLNVPAPKTDAQKSFPEDQLKNSNSSHPTKFNETADVKSSIFFKNDSIITFSITCNGRFENIQTEQQLPESSEKHLGIKETENINIAFPSSQVRPTDFDMMGTGTQFVKIVKQPPKIRDHYAEPISPELYSGKSKFKTNPPLSIYWLKMEENPLNMKVQPSKLWKSFKPADYEGNDSTDAENLSTKLWKGRDYDDVGDISGGSESEELT